MRERNFTVVRQTEDRIWIHAAGSSNLVGTLLSQTTDLTVHGQGAPPDAPPNPMTASAFAAWKERLRNAGWTISEQPALNRLR